MPELFARLMTALEDSFFPLQFMTNFLIRAVNWLTENVYL